ncbi:MAG: class I SAM-dependent methyltransferase [Pseudonocardiaceae bacterium]
MDHRHRPTSRRSLHSPQDVAAPTHFEWTRQPGIGPGLAILGELRGQTVVEVGCGGGHNLAHLVYHHDATGIGVDHDAQKITRARRAYSHLPRIRFTLADAADHLASTKPASIDICLSIFGAFSFADPISLLTTASRAIRPGGLLAMTLRVDAHHDNVIVLRRR